MCEYYILFAFKLKLPLEQHECYNSPIINTVITKLMSLAPVLTPPSANMRQRSAALTAWLCQRISQNGPLPFDDFMDAALYHPMYGYYNAPDFSIGEKGDFITAPEISPLFAQCFALFFQENFSQQDSILELGPGMGTFAVDLLTQLDANEALPKRYYFFEKNELLQRKQQAAIASLPVHIQTRCHWLDTLPSHFNGLIIANEVLDALAVKRFKVKDQLGYEQLVTWENNTFQWLDSNNPITQQRDLPDGYISETCHQLTQFIEALSHSLQKGIILFIDYGYGEQEYYNPARSSGTLTCFYQHRHHDDPLLYPGLQDITAHVNFTDVAEYGTASGANLVGFTTQAGFLIEWGLLEQAEELISTLSEPAAFQLQQSLKTLLMPYEMGDRIKIMGLSKEWEEPVAGFSQQDRRHEL